MSGDILGDLPIHLPNTEGSSDQEEIAQKSLQEEEGTKKDGPVIFIPGTAITLQTEEDIKKWIEERKRKWPSKKNLEAIKKEREYQTENKKRNATEREQEHGEDTHREGGQKRSRNICRFFQNHGKCKFGNKCRNIHESLGIGTNNNVKIVNGLPVRIPQLFTNEEYLKEKQGGTTTSLFKKLVQRDHFENENKRILEFLEYLDSRNLIDHKVGK